MVYHPPRLRKSDLCVWAHSVVLWILAPFFLTQVFAGVLFDYVISRVRFATLHRMLDMAEDLPTQPHLICLGSSRTGTSVQFEILTSEGEKDWAGFQAFNAGMPMGDPIVSERVYKSLRERGQWPRIVLIEVAPEFLQSSSGWLKEHMHRQMRWEDLPDYWDELVQSDLILPTALDRLAPLFVHRKGTWNWLAFQLTQIEASLAGPAKQGREERYDRMRQNWNRMLNTREGEIVSADRDQRMLEEVAKNLQGYSPQGLANRSLRRLLVRCNADGVMPILVAMPVRSAVRQLHTPEIERQFREVLSEWTEDGRILFLDFRGALPDDAFVDVHHANRKGAEQFSYRLAETLKPILRNLGP